MDLGATGIPVAFYLNSWDSTSGVNIFWGAIRIPEELYRNTWESTGVWVSACFWEPLEYLESFIGIPRKQLGRGQHASGNHRNTWVVL